MFASIKISFDMKDQSVEKDVSNLAKHKIDNSSLIRISFCAFKCSKSFKIKIFKDSRKYEKRDVIKEIICIKNMINFQISPI
jgi:hypothetical protein